MRNLRVVPVDPKKAHPFVECQGCDWHAPYNTQRITDQATWLQINFNAANPNWVRVDLNRKGQ
jgi:hypothetical protein